MPVYLIARPISGLSSNSSTQFKIIDLGLKVDLKLPFNSKQSKPRKEEF